MKSAQPTWERSFTEHRVRDHADFQDQIHYIEQNPVQAGLSITATEYKLGSASHPKKQTQFQIIFAPDRVDGSPLTHSNNHHSRTNVILSAAKDLRCPESPPNAREAVEAWGFGPMKTAKKKRP